MEFLYTADRVRYRRMTTSELREAYIVDGMFVPGQVTLCYTDVDRAIVGSAVPTTRELTLPVHKELASDYFAQRREIGVINIGGAGNARVDGEDFPLSRMDSLYIGRGSKEIAFSSASEESPAQLYILSYPAHKSFPTKLVRQSDAKNTKMGSIEECNERVINQSIRPGIVDSCQLVMGFTQLAPGSVWNTMPPHTHRRRSEIYFYFDLEADSNVFHFMGEPNEIRTIVVQDKQAIVSPSWSVHSGVGNRAYTFIWGMGGENQEFDDMDDIAASELL